MKHIKKVSLILTCLLAISGCRFSGENENSENQVSRYITGKSDFQFGEEVHFISAPRTLPDSTDVKSFDASYTMVVKNTSAGFVIGDSQGEYGDIVVCEISNAGDISELRIKLYSNGCYKETVSPKAISEEIGDDEEKILFHGTCDADGYYQTYLSVNDGTLEVPVNGVLLSEYTIPSFSLGTVGVYKGRGTSTALVDDISVTSDGETIFSDDFDGSFTNKLYEYSYVNEPTSAFSPYYFKTEEYNGSNALLVTSGFFMSEAVADAAPMFKYDFKADLHNTTSAKITMTSLGCMEIYLNGTKVTENYFEPGQPVYSKYLNYISYDVTDLLKEDNTITVVLFHGFYDRGVGNPDSRSPSVSGRRSSFTYRSNTS